MPAAARTAAAPRWGAPPAPITYRPARPPTDGRGRPSAPAVDASVEPGVAPARVAALLCAGERATFEAATAGGCDVRHAATVPELEAVMRAGRVDGVVISATAVAAAGARGAAAVAEFARAFATTPLAVLVTREVAPAVLVALGRSGARAVVDVRGPAGWGALQTLWPSAGMRTLAERAAATLEEPLDGATPGMRRFVLTLFEVSPRVRTVRGYAPRFGVLPTTLMSRFFRAGLPAPRRYLALAHLARAAQLFESPRWTVGSVAAELEHSSAQAFSRHLYLQLGVRPREFRQRYDGVGMVRRFAEEVVTPYQAVLRTFEPF